jgi:DHA3 family tetracycline resistance protein-like MFS transporter
MSRRWPAATVYLAMSGAEGFLFRMMSVIFSVFLIVQVGLDPFQLVLMGTILEVTYFVFEVPTGLLADLVSRRASVIVGWLGSGVAFAMLGWSDSFAMAALSQALWAISATFVSGADVAWITDEVGEEQARSLYVRAGQVWTVWALLGIGAGAGLAALTSLSTAIVASGVGTFLVGLGLIVVMPEERFRRPERSHGDRLGRSMVRTLKEGIGEVRAHHVLVLVLATAALHGASTEGFDRLADLHILRDVGLPTVDGVAPVLWFGVIDAGGLVLGLVALAVVKRRDLGGQVAVARLLMVIDAVIIASVVVFAVAAGFWVALGAVWVVSALRSARDPVFTSWLNQGLDPKTRATINSLGGQADAVGQSVGGPVLGMIAGRVSVPAAILTSGLFALPSLFLYVRAMRRGSAATHVPDDVGERLSLEDA